MTFAPRQLRFSVLILIIAFGMILAACSDETAPDETPSSSTTVATADATSDDPLVFGKGELPATVPADFPIPERAVIGSTMIDRTRGLTEVIVTFPANVTDVVTFFDVNLEALGYTVVSSSGSDGEWLFEFEANGVTGEVMLKSGGTGLSQGTLRILGTSTG